MNYRVSYELLLTDTKLLLSHLFKLKPPQYF